MSKTRACTINFIIRRAAVLVSLLFVGIYVVACDGGTPTGPTDNDTIGDGGGSVSLPGMILTVPSGSVPAGTEITVRAADPSDLPSGLGTAVDSIVPGTLFEFGPDGTTFTPPATISLTYDPARLPEGTNEPLLRVVRIDTEVSYVSGTRVDTLNNRISAPVDHFTFFAVALPELFPDSRDISISETVTVTDEVPTQNTPPISLTVSETVTITDAVPLEQIPPISLSVSETLTVTDDVVPPSAGAVRIDVTESVGVADMPTAVPDQDVVRIDVTEAVGVADVPEADAPGVVRLDVTEGLGVADAPSPVTQDQPSADVVEAVTVTDQPVVDAPGVVRLDVTEPVVVVDGIATDVQSPPVARAYALSGSGSVLVIDLNTQTVETTIAIPSGAERIVRRPGTDEIWVSEGSGGGITILDAATNTVVTSFASGTGFSSEIVFDASGGTAIVSDLLLGAGPAVVDAASRALVGLLPDIPGNGRVRGVAISDDGQTGWLSAGDYVGDFDVATRTYGTSLTGVAANEVVLRPGGASLWEYAEPDGWMLVRDPATLIAGDTVSTPFPRSNTANDGAHVFEADGSRAWATTEGGRLVALDGGSFGVVGNFVLTIPGGRLELDDTFGRAWLTERNGDEVFVVDLSTGDTLDRFTLIDPQDIEIYR